MNKNILILIVILFVLVTALGGMLMLGKSPASPAPVIKGVTIEDIDKNLSELSNLDNDLALFAKDDIVLQEMDSTLAEAGEITESTASLSKEESNLDTLDSDLTNLSGDEKINQEIDKSLQDIAL